MNVETMMNEANSPPSSVSKSHRRQQSIEEVLQQRLQRIVLLRQIPDRSIPRQAAPDRRRSTPESHRSSSKLASTSSSTSSLPALRRRTKSLDQEDREFRGASLRPCSSARLVSSNNNNDDHHDHHVNESPNFSTFQMDKACPSSPKKPQRNTSPQPRRRRPPKPLDHNRQSPRKPARFPEEIVTWSRFSPAPPVCVASPKKPLRSPSPGRLTRSDQTAACTETPSSSMMSNVLDHSAHQREQLELLSTQVDKFSLCEL